MVIEHLNVSEALEQARRVLEEEKNLSSPVQSSMKDLVFLVTAMEKRLGVNSQNSSKPPSQDLNKEQPGKEQPVTEA